MKIAFCRLKNVYYDDIEYKLSLSDIAFAGRAYIHALPLQALPSQARNFAFAGMAFAGTAYVGKTNHSTCCKHNFSTDTTQSQLSLRRML